MEKIFALDIGTRMVMGLVMTKNENTYEILASSRTEHRQRAMYDGQVHNVEEVAIAVRKIKQDLERKLNINLKKVAVAAAGRSLITETAEARRLEQFPITLNLNDVTVLELEAVQKALKKAGSGKISTPYHCVGYSVVKYTLDGQEISNLVGQRGKEILIDVIATFLPRTVIDSLIAVLDLSGLELESLTLEPIAAGYAAIPENMRRMNLALVDVGAGTSDIALTKNGSFFAYGMVPMAGDEITEVIASKFLLDFNIAEKLKREINTKQKIQIADFFGNKIDISKTELVDIIKPMVVTLAQKISSEVVRLNKEIPQAVILIGGGSLTPMLSEVIAELIGLPSTRVGVQIRERIEIVRGEKKLKGPDVITPIGIGISAIEEKGLHYYSVLVNERYVPIFELQLATLADVLLAAGIQPRALLGRPGAALSFELNNEVKVIKGSFGVPADIRVNDEKVSLDTIVKPGDKISFTPGIPGIDAKAKIRDVIPEIEPKIILFNNSKVEFMSQIKLNGKAITENEEIFDGSKIEFNSNTRLDVFLNTQGFSLKSKVYNIKINNHTKEILINPQIIVNGNIVTTDIPLMGGDKIEASYIIPEIKDLPINPMPLKFIVNGQEFEYPPQVKKVYWRGKELDLNEQIQDGMDLKIEGFTKMPILSEILPLINLPEKLKGRLITQVNGQDAQFTSQLYPGDRINIFWN